MKKIVTALVIAIYSLSANATFLDGNKLLQLLRSPTDLSSGGFIMAVADTEENTLRLLRDHNIPVSASTLKIGCIPNNVTVGQLKDIVKRFLEEYPQYRHYSAASLVSTALAGAFPC